MHNANVAAIIFVTAGHLLIDAERCIRYCAARGYKMVGVIRDDWPAAMDMLHDGRAEVLVIADPEHLDPERAPRVEYVAYNEPPAAAAGGRTQPARNARTERTHVVRRNAAK
jgi:hypothetical protein